MHYPQYRKYKNNHSYFKIGSKEDLEELKIMGSRYQVYTLKAKILPERVLISDLLEPENAYCDVITAEDYEAKVAWCKANLRLLA